MKLKSKRVNSQLLIVSIAVGLTVLSGVAISKDASVSKAATICYGPASASGSRGCPDIDVPQTQKGYPLTFIYIADDTEGVILGNQATKQATDYSVANFVLNIFIWYAMLAGTIYFVILLRRYIDGD